jgi:hypothetical protein
MTAAWIALAGAVWCAASIGAALLTGRWMAGRKPPVPGGTPEARTTPSSPPAPGPQLTPHDTGGVEFTIRGWYCGCIRQWDGRGALIATTPCQPIDWQRHEREMSP